MSRNEGIFSVTLLCRVMQGAVLGIGAPLGWFAFCSYYDLSPESESYEGYLYAYMMLGSVVVFSAFGFMLGRKEQGLERLALIDPLTGLFNRRHFDSVLEAELGRVHRKGSSLALLMIDIDHFKVVNDTWGHMAGDRVLARLATLLLLSIRRGDTVARVGGEEFAVVMPGTGRKAALAAAERLREHIASSEFDIGPERIVVRVSVGVAIAVMDDKDGSRLARDADDALYKAKQRGRNRTEVAWED